MKKTIVVKNNDMLDVARRLRREMTPQEQRLWYVFLRKYPVKFYKQRIIESFIVDFIARMQDWLLNLTAHSIILNRGKLTMRNEVLSCMAMA